MAGTFCFIYSEVLLLDAYQFLIVIHFFIVPFLVMLCHSLPLLIPFCLEINIIMSAFLWLVLTGIPLSIALFPAFLCCF